MGAEKVAGPGGKYDQRRDARFIQLGVIAHKASDAGGENGKPF